MRDLPPEFWHDSYRRRAFRRVADGTPTEKRGGAPSGIKRLRGDLNSLTITSASTREFIHPVQDRPLTLREAARLQSFPDGYDFYGTPPSVAKQIGNAVPPKAAQMLASHLLELEDSFGSTRRGVGGELLGFHLTSGSGMSPALARTDAALRAMCGKQRNLFCSEDARDWHGLTSA
jgi:DNA (cytosine-5)-methyltransferase 1